MTEAIATSSKKWFSSDNIKGLLGIAFFSCLTAQIVDDAANGAKADALCSAYRQDFAAAAEQVRSASQATIGGHKPSVSYSITIDGKEYGSFLPWARKSCDIIEPTYN